MVRGDHSRSAQPRTSSACRMLGRGTIFTFTLDLLRVCVRMMLHSNSHHGSRFSSAARLHAVSEPPRETDFNSFAAATRRGHSRRL